MYEMSERTWTIPVRETNGPSKSIGITQNPSSAGLPARGASKASSKYAAALSTQYIVDVLGLCCYI